MPKSPAWKRIAAILLLTAWFSSVSAHAQKPPQKRQVKDSTPAAPATASALPVGSYHALIVGINNYQSLPKLQTAVNDAAALAKLLQEQYGFADIKLLPNATRNQILLALNAFKHNLPENSNLLIYYAGHSYRDQETYEVYWLPVDAKSDNQDKRISADDITSDLRAIPSRHILIICDGYFSSVLTREVDVPIPPSDRAIYLTRLLQSKSRTVMSSPGGEPVEDAGAAGHSVFAYAVLKYLSEMEDQQFAAADLFPRIEREVAGRSDRVPQYSIIQNSGHEFGDFVFSRRVKNK